MNTSDPKSALRCALLAAALVLCAAAAQAAPASNNGSAAVTPPAGNVTSPGLGTLAIFWWLFS